MVTQRKLSKNKVYNITMSFGREQFKGKARIMYLETTGTSDKTLLLKWTDEKGQSKWSGEDITNLSSCSETEVEINVVDEEPSMNSSTSTSSDTNNNNQCRAIGCGKVYSTKSARLRHEKEFHNGKNIATCSRCDKTYKRFYLFKRHNCTLKQSKK